MMRDYTVEVFLTAPGLAIVKKNGETDYQTPERLMAGTDEPDHMGYKDHLLSGMRDMDASEDEDVGDGGVWHEEIWPNEHSEREDKTPYYRVCYQGTMGIDDGDTEGYYLKVAKELQRRIPDAEVRVTFKPVPDIEAEYGDDV